MLLNIVLAASMVRVGFSLPQQQAAAPAPIPTFLPEPQGTPPNFRLIEWHEESAHAQDHWTSCWNDDLTPAPVAPTWANDMQTCLDGYNRTDWSGNDCGGVGWYKATIKYENPQDCFHACQGCFEWLIHENSTKGYCWTVHGATPPNFGGDMGNALYAGVHVQKLSRGATQPGIWISCLSMSTARISDRIANNETVAATV
ncbi:MAG: hypothetical protein Q9222_004876 [Ikaeria aurantiellina]